MSTHDPAMRFIVEPRLLDHFGVGMYNTVEKALAELVANAYDADATDVDVTLTPDTIVVSDNGIGMTPSEVQDSYLRIGRDRRAASGEKTTERKRAVIGTKGIGKLAGFGIAEVMVVSTTRAGNRTTIKIPRGRLDEATSLEQIDLEPVIEEADPEIHGTEIRLEGALDTVGVVDEVASAADQEANPPGEGTEAPDAQQDSADDEATHSNPHATQKRHFAVSADKLRDHLATEMPTAPDWVIKVNGVEATAEDIPGDRFPIDDEIAPYGRVTGYFKIVTKRSKDLRPGLAVRVRGRVVQPRSLFGLNQQTHGFFVVTKIVGELRPDFIDPIEGREPDDAFAINTSRTGLNPESPKVAALNDYARAKLTAIADGEAQKRNARRKKAALARHPELEARMQRLAPEVYARLNTTIDRLISQLAKNEKRETIDEIVDMVIRYYESDALRALMESIRSQDDADIERLAELLAQFGAARIVDLARTLHTQLLVIDSVEQKVRAGALEMEIHRIIAANIWLLREELEYWFDNKAFATQLEDLLAAEFEWARLQRPDLVCRDDSPLAGRQATRLVVVEFKRPGVSVSNEELLQVMGYRNVFQKSLGQFGPENIEVIVIGDRFDLELERDLLSTQGIVLLSYVELLERAKSRYRDIYEKLVPPGAELPGAKQEASDDADDEDADEEELLTELSPEVSRSVGL